MGSQSALLYISFFQGTTGRPPSTVGGHSFSFVRMGGPASQQDLIYATYRLFKWGSKKTSCDGLANKKGLLFLVIRTLNWLHDFKILIIVYLNNNVGS